jgi:C-terminal processing protease CtpA/Prc
MDICRGKLDDISVFTNADSSFLAVTGNIPVAGGIVPYFFWSSFAILENMRTDTSGRLAAMLDTFFLSAIRHSAVKGVILDVRGNGGGNAIEPGMILGYFSSKDFVMAYTKSKNGESRLDYTPWTPFRVMSRGNVTDITVPVVILTDINSVSCSELTTMGVRNLPNGNGVQIGKTTYGGNGKLTLNAAQNGGQFSSIIMFNGLEPRYQQIKLVYTSSEMTKAAFDGKCYEGKGVPPNIDADLDIVAYQNGTDTQLERALRYIENRN